MASQYDYQVHVSCGGSPTAEVGLTRGNDLVFAQEYAPNLRTRVNLGRMTRARIEQIQDNLERLKVHAVE